ncbi:VOC family protein [Carnobacterium maltaromaticum]|uniref:VOC family protein n=1 Tax=Carnobacterium maltaromaticum TaxID=2751 RepID=UPI0007049D90|nr:VOC family protein [Carnobacterium maltaromaticum]KRN72200.1 protein PhnB [Carnobacterium maltaromaticum]MBC9809346.1 VOC family protein [Carnobacterium maltaromaticum]MDT1943485.1 VOC family protein [Carnobacterium maltaromaticum]MDT1998865.1 VOC family protein [Carnobacterium maltaromaticum]TFJ24698.1 VOC family protein [Carnobacterium maltaromaticum]
MENKFAPCLWVDNQVEEMTELYTKVFENGKPLKTLYFLEDAHGKIGDILTQSVQLANQEFILLNGGPEFKATPSISYMVTCTSETQLQVLWQELSEGGKLLMNLAIYPGVGQFGWLEDRFGISWQFSLDQSSSSQKITPCFMFSGEQYGNASRAVAEWIEVFQSGEILEHYSNEDLTTKLAKFTLHQQEFMAMDSAVDHDFTFSLANSFYVYCENQKEIDRLWTAITSKGTEMPCGWMGDRFGVAWQTVTRDMDTMLDRKNLTKALAVTQAVYGMMKIDSEELRRIYNEA